MTSSGTSLATVRPLARADLPMVREWMRGSGEAPRWSDEDLELLVLAPSATEGRVRRAWAAVDATDQPCGFAGAAAVRTGDKIVDCELEFLFTAPAARRHGIAKLLLGTIVGWGDQIGAEELLLEVRSSNGAARQLYAGAGFAAVGVRRAYYSDPVEDAVLMRLPLGD